MKRSSWRYLWKSEDIRNKLLITLLLLAIYRFAANIPVPGIDRATVAALTQLRGAEGNLINLLDMLSGGAVSNFSILAMGVYPYITAQIILQLLTPIIPALERKMQDDPREGRIWMENGLLFDYSDGVAFSFWSNQHLQPVVRQFCHYQLGLYG